MSPEQYSTPASVGFQQFLHRHEAVAFPLKRIYNLQCRVYRGIVDIMEQDDLIGGRIFQDRRLHLGCIELFPVPGIDGPLYHGHLQQLPVRRIHGPVWRAEPIWPPSQQRFQRLLCTAYLPLQRLPGDPLKPYMVPGVAAHLMALCLHPPDQVLIAFDLLANQEKGGACPPLLQAVQ